jgi:YYY domain-containing protein
MIQVAYAIIWWLILLVIGLIAFPLVSRVCGGLLDKGYSISKILGILLFTYFSWLLASLHILKFGYLNISIAFVLLIALSFYLGRKNLSLKNLPLKSMLITEALFSLAYMLFLVFLFYTPDIGFAHSEDFMDFGFIQSITRSGYFPPPDPWLAGSSIPYYYGGHMVAAALMMFSKVPHGIAYNLAVAMFFALTLSASFGIGYNLTKRKLYGFAALIFVGVIGFLSGAFQLAAFYLHRDVMGYYPVNAHNFFGWLHSFDFISANWLIKFAAIRNPFYAFLVGDLHSDVTDIPFQLLFITLILALFLAKKRQPDGGIAKSDSLLTVVILGLSLGFLAFVDTWSFPTYILFAILAFILLGTNLGWKRLLGVIALSIILYLPYHLTRGSGGFKDIGVVTHRTELLEFINVFALFLFAMFSFLYVSFKGRLFKGETLFVGIVLAIIIAAVSFLLHFQLLLILIPLILVPLYCIYKAREKKETEFVLTLVLTGALIVLFCEVFYIATPLGGDFARFNTVTHFYVQIWVLFALAAAYAIYWVSSNVKSRLKYIWATFLFLLVLASLIQPIGLVTEWTSQTHDYFGINRGTLDGLAYIKIIAPGDYEAINWINEHIEGSHVILEAPSTLEKQYSSYTFTSRISTMTGLPTVVGWTNTHEVMWRGNWDKVAGRDGEVDSIYNNPDSEQALSVLRKYKVEYIYIGGIEKQRYPVESLQKFASDPERYQPIYEKDGVTIYQVMS